METHAHSNENLYSYNTSCDHLRVADQSQSDIAYFALQSGYTPPKAQSLPKVPGKLEKRLTSVL